MNALSETDFAELYQKYSPMVLRRCRTLLRDEDKAVDAMQDVFIKIFEQKERIETVCASFFYVTATRVCLNKIRADKIRSGPDFEKVSETLIYDKSQSDQDKVEAGILLESIFASRDEKDWTIARLHFVDGYTFEETAKMVNMSVSGIQKRLRELQKHANKFKN